MYAKRPGDRASALHESHYPLTQLSLGASTSIEDVVIASTQNSWTSEPSFGCRLGLFDPVGQQRESILSTHLFRKTTPYLALDLNADPATPANNRLYLEQLPSNMASDAPIAWSQRRYSQTACSSEFRSAVFDLAVCGKDVMHALGSNNYLLRLSMTERTLVLPPDLFTAVLGGFGVMIALTITLLHSCSPHPSPSLRQGYEMASCGTQGHMVT